MEKDFCHKYQLWKLFRRIRNQTDAHAQKGVKCPLRPVPLFAYRREITSASVSQPQALENQPYNLKRRAVGYAREA